MGLPTGEVCFLFSDIEGSTRLARAMGTDAWAALLRAHDRVVDEAVADGGGHRRRTRRRRGVRRVPGPGRCGGGGRRRHCDPRRRHGPRDRRSATVRADRPASWRRAPDRGRQLRRTRRPLRIARQRGGERTSDPPLGRRWPSSSATGCRPARSSIDEGFRRLKDFDEPRRLYRLVVPDVADDDRPLRTVDLPTNLPDVVTSFVGRERDVAFGLAALERSRLLTLTGPGGTGKTRLAIGTAAAARTRFPDGTWLVDLAPVRDPRLVASAIGATLGVRETPEEPVQERLKGYLARTTTAASPRQPRTAAPRRSPSSSPTSSAPRRAAACSRRVGWRCASTGEQEYPVPPLDSDAAVGLFVERARLVRPAFDPAPVMSDDRRDRRAARRAAARGRAGRRADAHCSARMPSSSGSAARSTCSRAARWTCRSASARCGRRSAGASTS